jgi:hypothetical protein
MFLFCERARLFVLFNILVLRVAGGVSFLILAESHGNRLLDKEVGELVHRVQVLEVGRCVVSGGVVLLLKHLMV